MDTITGKAIAHRVIANKHIVAIEHATTGYTELYTIAGGSSLIFTITNSDMRDNNHVYTRNARGALTTARPLTIDNDYQAEQRAHLKSVDLDSVAECAGCEDADNGPHTCGRESGDSRAVALTAARLLTIGDVNPVTLIA